jgi:hypothetical protein
MAFRILNTRLDWMPEGEKPASGEALVFPANDHLWMLSGPGLELKKSLGKEVELEAVRQGPVEPGALVVTSGEAAGYRLLFHAVVMGQDLQWIRGAGTRAVASVLDRAAREKVSSLHVHPLFRGVHGRREEPAREMLGAFLEGLEAGSTLKSVSILYAGAEEKAFLNDILVRLLAEPH